MDADEIRTKYLDFMAENGHAVIPRAPLIPKDDPTTLFTGSGMQPLLPYLLGADHPAGSRVADSQTCLRVQDIEEVGDNRHTTFFEMLGNWSLGDYFKDDQLRQVWTFLTERVGLDPNRIYVSCFIGDPEHGIPKDAESAAIWTELFTAAGVSADQVELDTEERGAEIGNRRRAHRVLRQEELVVPRRQRRGHAGRRARRARLRDLLPLPAGAARPALRRALPPELRLRPLPRDRQLGLHGVPAHRDGLRAAAEAQRRLRRGPGAHRRGVDRQPDVFRISLLWPIVELEELSGRTYDDETLRMRVIADHLRGATFLAVDGVMPGNKAQGYVMRRLIRRAVRFAFDLGLEENFFPQIIPTIAGIYEAHYPEVAEHAEYVVAVLPRRSRRSGARCARGSSSSALPAHGVTGAELFVLYDTYGFPVELAPRRPAARDRGERGRGGRVRRAHDRAARAVAAGERAPLSAAPGRVP